MAMSNEELVAEIQAGALERMSELWEQVEGLVKWKAKRIMTALELRGNMCGVDFEDLVQCGYPAMVAAVGSYSPESGSFSRWLMYHLQTAFAEATGYRTKRERNDPLNDAFSLDKPLGDEEDGGLFGDLIPDQRAATTLEAIEERRYREQLHEALDSALNTLPERCGDVLRLRYYENMTLDETGQALGINVGQARRMEREGTRKLRAPKVADTLRPFYDFDFYHGTGLASFQSTGLSIQERYVIKTDRRKSMQK